MWLCLNTLHVRFSCSNVSPRVFTALTFDTADVSTTTTIFLVSKRDVTATSTVLSLLVLSPAPFISLTFQCTHVYYHLSRGFFKTSNVNCMHRSSSLPSSPTTAVNLLVIQVRLFSALSSVSTNVTFVASTGQMALVSHMAIKALPVKRLHNHYSLVPLYCHLLQHSLSFKECHLPSTG